MQQQRNRQEFFQALDELRPMRTWGEMTALDQQDQRMIELLTIIVGKGNESEKEKVIKTSATIKYRRLLAISENSFLVKNFFKEEKYSHIWKARLDQNQNEYSDPGIKLHPFNRLMSFYISDEFEAWILGNRHQTPEARILGEKARNLGIDITSLIQDLLPIPQEYTTHEIGIVSAA